MSSALIPIVVYAIREKYVSEKAFYSEQLGISPQSWDRWKKGEQGLKYDNMKIISTLFTDYEWMLVQKVVRNAEIVPEIMADPVKEYLFLKYEIAKKWLRHGLVRLEWRHTDMNEVASNRKSNMTILQLIADYNFWGYNDVVELRLPGVIRQQIETGEIKLLTWFDQESEKLKQE
ncbi:hypothetical protein I4Q36_07625 [Tuanshanicoccus lijuaniae]|uniref:hypothetical protein n=1 Tax=Aerococcaceae bacterium zg-1292 TaxID=2774330 RepID=UPI001937DDC2|nr:hypothetical protein [Aerococcaceae bacterium zg-1292]MBF6626771.1 hypothetical protein [Aerococcaceae bacterium zg-BR9]MBF6978728.1 hypothetical protein [Aerococcaceae bacterium zg-BR22]MBS4456855.1 hypothetical protein [Aerococcaceae bacterium zg-A91]MBS4458667.1 hypothetical protein [Aerococcaceae bacterium zg-BR33]